MADAQSEKEDVRQWFLRIGGETIFGPVSTQGLIVWAEQGRILPGHEVSTDRKRWLQAVAVDLLDMRWFVDDGQGELRGPLNRLAAEALIKSGKVPEGSQLISADEVETDGGGENSAAVPAKRSEKPRSEPMPEEMLRQRIRELESMVTSQRDRLAKLSDGNALETVQHERDVLAALVKETEAQRDTILRNADKDSKASERKLELLRQQVKKLESQLEDANSRILLSDEAAAGRAELIDKAEAARLVETARREALEGSRESENERAAVLIQERESLRSDLEVSRKALSDARDEVERLKAEHDEASGRLETRLAELERSIQFHTSQANEARLILDEREAELERERARLLDQKQALVKAEEARQVAECAAKESAAAFAELLNDANARDTRYLEKIATLEKTCAQSPDETARFFADQAAVYELVKAEIDEISKSMESERTHVEQLKEWSSQRQQSLLDRKQALLKRMGDSPGEMTRRTVREQPSDALAARLRAELENLRVTYQREVKFAETREREYQEKLRVLEAEGSRLLGQAVEGEKRAQRVQELEEAIKRREHELADERRTRDAEREQFMANQQALLMRIEALEKSAKPVTPDEIQTAEAHNVKLASWMRLKR